MNRAKRNVNCLTGNPSPGQVCAGGAIFLGQYSGSKYMISPGGCTDSATPTCAGGEDTVTKYWRGSTGTNVAIAGLETTVTGQSIASTQSGFDTTPIIVADASISSDSAADYCNDMVFGGYDDWFLPAKSELAFFYCRSNNGSGHSSLSPSEDPNCVGFGGKMYVIGGVPSSTSYWSSTQHGTNSASSAWFQSFNTGLQSSGNKSVSRLVRCMRRY